MKRLPVIIAIILLIYGHGHAMDEDFEAGCSNVNEIDTGGYVTCDYATSNLAGISGLGDQCLRINIADSTLVDAAECYFDAGASRTVHYSTTEFIVQADNMGNGLVIPIGWALDANFDNLYLIRLVKSGADIVLRLSASADGGALVNYDYSPAITIGKRYKVDVKWDTVADEWTWRVNGVEQGNGGGSLTSGAKIFRSLYWCGDYGTGGTGGIDICLDNLNTNQTFFKSYKVGGLMGTEKTKKDKGGSGLSVRMR